MAKRARFAFRYRKSTSKFHKKVGEILRDSPIFKNFKLYQEYPVTWINPQMTSLARCHYDWVLLDLKVVIEVHGQQHFQQTRFGGISEDEAQQRFEEQTQRDYAKQLAATDN